MPDENSLRVGAHNAYSRAELVVAIKHIDRVSLALNENNVGHKVLERDPDLGLGLLTIEDDAAAAAAFREWDPSSSAAGDAVGAQAAAHLHERPVDALDSFTRGLRGYFAARFAGWAPLVGKNRVVGNVTGGGGKISHGGDGKLTATHDRFPQRAGRRGVAARVGVLDTSVSSNEWFAGAWTSPAREVLGSRGTRHAVAGHATFVAGLVLRQAPGCTLTMRQVLDNRSGEATSWEAAKAIVQLARSRPHVINLSFVCFTEDGQAPLALAAAIDRVDPETVIVAAAGNHGDVHDRDRGWEADDGRKPGWPAALDRVIAVGAADHTGSPTKFTPANVEWIDALAPGEGVLSTYLSGPVRQQSTDAPVRFTGYARWSGTSFAAASVTGAIAARVKPGTSAPQAWQDLLSHARRSSRQAPGAPVLLSLR
jgi:membrane-anchored mycosin MYCP